MDPFQVEPKKEKFIHQVNIKLTEEEHNLLILEAERLGYSKPSFVKYCLGEYFRNK